MSADAVDVRPRWRRLGAPAAVVGVVAVATLALHLRDPHTSTWGACPWEVVTGTDCPGCGGLRAVNDLTNLRVVDAASSNLAFVASLPFVVVVFGRWVNESWTGVRRPVDRRKTALVSVTAGMLVVAWWIARNLPGLEWLRA